jgi:hypothetical protein
MRHYADAGVANAVYALLLPLQDLLQGRQPCDAACHAAAHCPLQSWSGKVLQGSS